MGIWSSLVSALGLRSPPRPRELPPFTLTPRARKQLLALPADQGLMIRTVPVQGGRGVTVDSLPVAESSPHFPELPLLVDELDYERLAGLELDFDAGRWAVRTELVVHGGETPNPHARCYQTDRWLLRGTPRSFVDPGNAPPLARALLELDGVEGVLFRDNSVTLTRAQDPIVSWDKLDGQVAGVLREHFLLCGRGLEPAQLSQHEDPLLTEVEAVLGESVLPAIRADGGDLHVLGIHDGVVQVRLVGACSSCPASTATLEHGVKRALLQALPDKVRDIEALS